MLTYKYMDSNFVGKAISNNTTDDVVVKADGKIGNSLSSQQHFAQFVTRPIHEKKNW